jgi:hypothetical protein
LNLEIYVDDCQWGQGLTANVVSTVLWFLTGATMLVMGVPERQARPPPETQTVTYQQTTNADGTVTVAETAVVKGIAVETGLEKDQDGPQV